MTYIRKKMINGSGPYFYEVRSVRDGKQVHQEFVKYWGTEDPRLDGRFQALSVNKESQKIRTAYNRTYTIGNERIVNDMAPMPMNKPQEAKTLKEKLKALFN